METPSAPRSWEDLAVTEAETIAISETRLTGPAFAATGFEQTGRIGAGMGRLSSVRAVVDFAVEWIEQHRN